MERNFSDNLIHRIFPDAYFHGKIEIARFYRRAKRQQWRLKEKTRDTMAGRSLVE